MGAEPVFGEKLILSLAEKAFLPLSPHRRIHIGDKSLVAIREEQGQLSLLARKEGKTLMTDGNKQYQIFIFNKEKKAQALKLNKLLKSFWGLDWSLSDKGDFEITGKLHRLYDWVDLAKLSQKENIPYQFKAVAGEGLKKPIRYYFKHRFINYPPFELAWQKKALAYIPQGSQMEEYKKILKPFGLSLQEDPLWLFKAPFIEIEIAWVESLHSSGFSLGGKRDFSQTFSGFASLLSFLNFLKNSGQGKTLHHSSFTGQSGQKLQIQSGGQIPFGRYSFKTEQKIIQWKSHGLNLTIVPKAGKRDQIELDIKARLSEPLSFASIDSPPPLKTQSLENKLVLKNREIVKLFQLKKQSQGKQNKGQLGFLLDFSPSFLSGKNKYKLTQFIFIQAKIKKLGQKSPRLFDSSLKSKQSASEDLSQKQTYLGPAIEP